MARGKSWPAALKCFIALVAEPPRGLEATESICPYDFLESVCQTPADNPQSIQARRLYQPPVTCSTAVPRYPLAQWIPSAPMTQPFGE